jgi:hypothetical protein
MKFHQGKFKPKNPSKYVGSTNNIVYRSSWELKLMIWLDESPNVINWASEEMAIPYISPLDNKPHRYFVDFVMKWKDKDNRIRTALVEVKPWVKRKVPVMRSRLTKRYLNEAAEYAVNQAKWEAAEKWAKKQNWEFIIFDEYDLGIALGKRPE